MMNQDNFEVTYVETLYYIYIFEAKINFRLCVVIFQNYTLKYLLLKFK